MSYEMALEALADPTRRALFERIGKAPTSVKELVDAFPISQPAVSQHLRVLREADLVQVRRDGARRIYTVSRKGLAALRAYVESFWNDVLSAFADGASQSPGGAAQ
jgi:DNA-binding transcriptional ArsR family regulator